MIDPINKADVHSAGGPLKPTGAGASDQEIIELRLATMCMQLTSMDGSNKVVKGSKKFPKQMGNLQNVLSGLVHLVNQGANLRGM